MQHNNRHISQAIDPGSSVVPVTTEAWQYEHTTFAGAAPNAIGAIIIAPGWVITVVV